MSEQEQNAASISELTAEEVNFFHKFLIINVTKIKCVSIYK